MKVIKVVKDYGFRISLCDNNVRYHKALKALEIVEHIENFTEKMKGRE